MIWDKRLSFLCFQRSVKLGRSEWFPYMESEHSERPDKLLLCFRDHIHNSSYEWNQLIFGQPLNGVEGSPQKTPKQKKFQNMDQIKTNKTPHCSMHYPTANISWMAFTYGNLLALCSFPPLKHTLNQVLRLLGPKQWTFNIMTQVSKMLLEANFRSNFCWSGEDEIEALHYPCCLCLSQNIGPQNNLSKGSQFPQLKRWSPFY